MDISKDGHSSRSTEGYQTVLMAVLASILMAVPIIPMIGGMAGGDTASELVTGYGDGDGDGFGWSVTPIGDVDEDGLDDVAVGSPYNDTGDSDSGSVFIFLGPKDGINASEADIAVRGAAVSELLGWSIAASDVNDDGDMDLIAGAPGADKTYVIWHTTLNSALGSGTLDLGTSPAGVVTLTGPAGSSFGFSVAGAPKYDGVAGDEVVVGAPNASSDDGGAYVYNGAGGMTSTPYLTLNISTGGAARLGYSVSSAGSFKGAVGSCEIAVGAPKNNSVGGPDSGTVYVIPAGTSGDVNCYTDPTLLRIEDQMPGTGLGSSLATLGDMNSDGMHDLAIGAPNGTGQVFVILGTNSLGRRIDTMNMPTFTGSLGQSFGHSVASAGDVNFDGNRDMIVGAPFLGNKTRGAAFVFFGTGSWSSSTSVLYTQADIIRIGPGVRIQFGAAVASAGDFDDDGKGDFMVGAPFTAQVPGLGSREGAAHIFRHNVKPSFSAGKVNLCDPISGVFNGSAEFTFEIIYSDPENDRPSYVKLELYSKADGSKSSAYPGNNGLPSLTKANPGGDHTQGKAYQLITTLPHGQWYYKFVGRAATGNLSVIQYPAAGDLPLGPLVDAQPPSVVELEATSTGTDEDGDGKPDSSGPYGVNGTAQLTWMAPFDNDTQALGNVREPGGYDIRYSEQEITVDNFDQSPSITALGVNIPAVGPSNTQEVLNISGLTPKFFYHFALMTTDAHNNTSPLSNSPSAQAFEILIDNIPPIDTGVYDVKLYDTPDNPNKPEKWGGNLTVTWRRGASNDYADITLYNIYISQQPITNDILPSMKPEIKHHPHTDGTLAYLETMGGQPLRDGEYYYVAVTPLDEWKNEAKVITGLNTAGPTKPMNNYDDPPEVLTGLTAYDTPDDYGKSITVEWDESKDPDFVHYYLYVSVEKIKDLGDPILERFLVDDGEEMEVREYQGDRLKDGKDYYFAVTAKDYNEMENREIVAGSNYVGPVVPRNNTDEDPPVPIEGVVAFDTPNDRGGSITVQWNHTTARDFDHYNVYISMSEITDLYDMEVAYIAPSRGTTPVEMVITSYDGEEILNGVGYYFAVTAVDYNGYEGNEDTKVTDGNTFGPAEAVDNTDLEPPAALTGITIGDYGKTWVEIRWTPLTAAELPDFNQYRIVFARDRAVKADTDTTWDADNDVNMSMITTSSSKVYGLLKGREYHFQMVVVDDNDNVNYSAAAPKPDVFVTLLGGNQLPVLSSGSITPTEGDTETKFTFEITWADPDGDTWADKGFLKVVVDGYPLQAKFVPKEDFPNYKNGAVFILEYSRPFAGGVHEFHFEANDRPDTLSPVRFPEDPLQNLTFTVNFPDLDGDGIPDDEDDDIDGDGVPNGEDEFPTDPKKSATEKSRVQLVVIFLIMVAVFGGVGGTMYLLEQKRAKEAAKRRKEEEKKRKAYEDHIRQVGEWRCACGKTRAPMDEEAICVECGDVHEILEMDADLMAVKEDGEGGTKAVVEDIPEDPLMRAGMATPLDAAGGPPPGPPLGGPPMGPGPAPPPMGGAPPPAMGPGAGAPMLLPPMGAPPGPGGAPPGPGGAPPAPGGAPPAPGGAPPAPGGAPPTPGGAPPAPGGAPPAPGGAPPAPGGAPPAPGGAPPAPGGAPPAPGGAPPAPGGAPPAPGGAPPAPGGAPPA